MAEAGSLLKIENVTLPLATFSKFQPQSVDFLDISNPKAVYPFNTNNNSLGVCYIKNRFCEFAIL